MKDDAALGETGSIRPTKPDPGLLEAATMELSRRMGASRGSAWETIAYLERRGSTLFRLRTVVEEQPLYAFYKVDLLPRGLDETRRAKRLKYHRESLRAERQLAPAMGRELSTEGVSFDEPLAMDPDRLHAIRIEVAGQRLGKTLRHVLPRQGRSPGQVYHLVGRTLRIVQDVGSTMVVPMDVTAESRVMEDIERSAAHLNRPQRVGIEHLLGQYLGTMDQGRGVVWAHRDISQSNLLVTSSGIGIIDFSWRPEVFHSDLAQLLARLESELPQQSRWTRAMVDAVFDGYGIRRTDPDPSWRLALVQRALKMARSRRRRARKWARETLRDLGVAGGS